MRRRGLEAMVGIVMGCLLLGGLTPSRGEEGDLFQAAYAGDLARVKTLIAAGADVNARNKDGSTALMSAFEKGHLKVAKALIAAGADVKTTYYGGLTKIKVGNKFGLADHEGRIIAVPRFGHIAPQGNGLFEVCLDCEEIEKPGLHGRQAVYSASKSWGYIDGTGKVVIPPQFDETRSFSEGFAVVRVGCTQGYRRDLSIHKMGGKYGYIDKSGNYLVKPQYDYARPFKDGMGAVCIGKKDRSCGGLMGGIYGLKNGEKWGYVDYTGNVVVTPQYRAANDYSMGFAAVCSNDNNMWGYIDKQGKYVIAPEFQNARDFSMGLAPVKFMDNHKWGYIDNRGKVVIEPKYDDARAFISEVGYTYVEMNGKRWMIDQTGKIVKEVPSPRKKRMLRRTR